MSQAVDRMARARDRLERVVGTMQHGPPDKPYTIRRGDLARQHMVDWLDARPPSPDSSRGGSSSPGEVEDNAQEGALARRVVSDLARFDSIAKTIETLADEAESMMLRYVETVDTYELEADPECVSCRRPQKHRRDGYYSPVAAPDPHLVKRVGRSLAESVQRLHLCRFCRAHAILNAVARSDRALARAQREAAERGEVFDPRSCEVTVTVRDYVDLRTIEVLHEQGEPMARRWFSRRQTAA